MDATRIYENLQRRAIERCSQYVVFCVRYGLSFHVDKALDGCSHQELVFGSKQLESEVRNVSKCLYRLMWDRCRIEENNTLFING